MISEKKFNLINRIKSVRELNDKEVKKAHEDIDKTINLIKKDLRIKEKNRFEKIKELNKYYDEIKKLKQYKNIVNRKNKVFKSNRLGKVNKFLQRNIIPTSLQLSKSKSQLFKMFTVGIIGELLQYYFVDPTKNYFTSIWFLRTFATAFGFIVNELFTFKTASQINKSITTPIFKNNKKRLAWTKNLVNNIVKFSTHGCVMALTMYLTAGKTKGILKIFKGVAIAVLGSIFYDFFMKDVLQVTDPIEKEYIRHTNYYKKSKHFNKIISSTFKVAISIVGMDIAADGDLDSKSLIKFLVTIFALPLFFFSIEPHIMNECGALY